VPSYGATSLPLISSLTAHSLIGRFSRCYANVELMRVNHKAAIPIKPWINPLQIQLLNSMPDVCFRQLANAIFPQFLRDKVFLNPGMPHIQLRKLQNLFMSRLPCTLYNRIVSKNESGWKQHAQRECTWQLLHHQISCRSTSLSMTPRSRNDLSNRDVLNMSPLKDHATW